MSLKIPVTICHGLSSDLTIERVRGYLQIAQDMGFSSINYDQLHKWLIDDVPLPKQPILFDFDHPMKSIFTEIFPLLNQFGFTGNLFVNTGFLDDALAQIDPTIVMRWNELSALVEAGWTIGAHTHRHPDLSDLDAIDPFGKEIGIELDVSNELLKEHLGVTPKYFAFTGVTGGGTWSESAELEVKKRYNLGRLWIFGNKVKVGGELIRYAELVGSGKPDEADGGPPHETRYITKRSDLFRLPAMELERGHIYEPEQFRKYLAMAVS